MEARPSNYVRTISMEERENRDNSTEENSPGEQIWREGREKRKWEGGGRKKNKRRQRREGKTVGFAFSFGAERRVGW